MAKDPALRSQVEKDALRDYTQVTEYCREVIAGKAVDVVLIKKRVVKGAGKDREEKETQSIKKVPAPAAVRVKAGELLKKLNLDKVLADKRDNPKEKDDTPDPLKGACEAVAAKKAEEKRQRQQGEKA